jgi:hypothetical protein
VLEIKPGTAVVEQDVLLEPAGALTLLLRDPAGKPLTGVRAARALPRAWSPVVTCKTDVCHAYELEPGKPRMHVFHESRRKLAASLVLRGDEKAPIEVTLRPTGGVKGRLAGRDGTTLAGISVRLTYRDRPAATVIPNELQQAVTGPDGSFSFDTVLPGLVFELSFQRRYTQFNVGALTVGSGETKDLGTLAARSKGE